MTKTTDTFEDGDLVTLKINGIVARMLNEARVANIFFKAEDVILHDKETEVAHD